MAKATLRTSQSKSRVRKQQHSRFHPTTLFITGPQTRSFKHSMDESEVQRDQELWTDGLEEMFVDILYQETIEGKLVGSKITNCDHLRLAEQLSRVGRKAIDASQIRGKITRLRQRLRMFTDLMGQTGMGWNPHTKTVIATDEHWANAIKVHSQWKKFKTNGCRDYDLLCTIFGQSVATGVCHFASTQQSPTSEEEDRLEEEVRAKGSVLGTTTDASIDIDEPNIDGPVGRQRQARRRRREPIRSSISPQFSKTLEIMAATAAMRNELDKQFLEECSRKRSKGNETEFGSDASYSKLGVAMKFLDEIIPPLPAHQYNKAVEKFMHDKAVEAFLMMPPNRKIDWIWGLQ
ncbi:L10-interacting MYB domain-containing protein-like isoform X1 [Juglans regia]|uniref:L10-interacting MYB domain-containing protein-like isoform X1 n=1 Tax=Juglans regia TaxID=51240 RepID=A0A6P9EH72_JUGRE|nr:L10-interacting MYB domain-containing protein-like isoform X1 [Juglans regia]